MGPQRQLHARNEETGETLCGGEGLSVVRWSETAEEIACAECRAKIPTFTAEDIEAAIEPALHALMRSQGDRS